MRRILPFLPIILATLGLPTLAVQTEAPKPVPTQIIQIIRTGKGQPRVRDMSAARVASLRTLDQGGGHTRPYQVAKPGEGAPKN
jgi:hypothetical protein